MQFKNALIAATAVAGVAMAQSTLSVATPQTLVQCQPYLINITGGTPPFNVRVTEAGNTSNVIETLTQTSSRQITWNVNVKAGTTITLYVVDSTGQGGASGQSNAIGQGPSDCLNGSASISTGGAGSGGGSSSSAGGSSSSGNSSPTSSAGGASSSGSSSAGSPSRSSSPASSPSQTAGNNGAASLSGYSAAVAGAVGVVVAALF